MKRKKNLSSVLSVLGLLFTIIVAVFLPQLVFAVQDYRQTSTVELVARESYEVLTSDAAYQQDINARMNNLASVDFGNVAISKIARSMDINDCMDLVDSIKGQTYMTYLAEILPTTFGEVLPYISVTELRTCDCYIVYNEEFTNSVLLMFWYMVFDLPGIGCQMELIVDSETETIYYVRLQGASEKGYVTESTESTDTIIGGEEYYHYLLIEDTMQEEMLPAMSAEIEAIAENFPALFMDYYTRYYGNYHLVGDSSLSEAYIWDNVALGERVYTMAYALPYTDTSDGSLFFRFHVEISEEYGPDISIGIPVIRRFVQS